MSQPTAPDAGPPVPLARSDDENAGRLDHASNARIWLILATLIVFSEVIPVQYAMVGLLIPKFGLAFPAAGNNATWSLTIIGVVGAATLPLLGKASDLWGKKRSLLVASAILLIGTVICAVTSSWALFLVGRGMMAISFGMSAVAYGVVRDLIPRRLIPLAMGLVATGFGASAVLAPLIGGALTDHYSYKSVFWFLVCYVAVTAPALWLIVPESPFRVRQRLDIVGALALGLGLAGVLIYVSEGSSWGWGGATLGYLLGGLVLLIAFVVWENSIGSPLFELSILRNKSVAIAMGISLLGVAAITVPQVAIPYMFETPKPDDLRASIINGAAAQAHVAPSLVRPYITFLGDIGYAGGMSVFQIAWHITLATSIAAMLFGPVGGLLARRYGARLSLILAGVVLLAAFELWTRWHGAWADQALIGSLWGAGTGFFFAGGPNLLIDEVAAQRQGITSAMYAAFGSVGTALATAGCTAVIASHPFQISAPNPKGGAPIVSSIPQVYTNNAFSEMYLVVGGSAALLLLILALIVKAGRTPARGGILEADIAAPEAAPVGTASLAEATAPQAYVVQEHVVQEHVVQEHVVQQQVVQEEAPQAQEATVRIEAVPSPIATITPEAMPPGTASAQA